MTHIQWHGWTGWTGDGRKCADIRRSHGNWLALVYFKNGQPMAGEYFSYGEPGAIQRAKAWCESKAKR